MTLEDAESRLVIALDFSDTEHAHQFVRTLALPRAIYKIGLELLFAGGVDLVRRLAAEGYGVFVDAKLLDIGNTVERATAQIAGLGAHFLTVHAQDRHTLDAAVRGVRGSNLKLLGVTLLTSIESDHLSRCGYALSAPELVELRASLAAEAGLYGVVASPREAASLRARFGGSLAIVTPGIRPEGSSISKDDQVRTATPRAAIEAGADYIVVGRPILEAADPPAAARAIIAEIAAALPYTQGRT